MRAPWLAVGACALVWLVACGCKTSQEGPGSGSLAAVMVKAGEPLAVARAVSEVFQEAGYQPTPVPANRSREMRMVFEKEGTAKDTLMYGGWSFESLWYRVKIRISPLDAATKTYLVTCDVFRVHHRGDRHFEEEQRLKSAKRGSFRELLEQAKKRVEL